MGDRSRDLRGHGKGFTWEFVKKFIVARAIWAGKKLLEALECMVTEMVEEYRQCNERLSCCP
mgnify:CR=1 FL=1